MHHRFAGALLCLCLSVYGTVEARSLRVVTSILPVHALVASVMQGLGEPLLLLSGGASPHHYALKPSQASALQAADVVFWVGPDLENFLLKPVQTIVAPGASVALADTSGLTRYPYRDLADDLKWNANTHRHSHASQGMDPHLWLDPHNAIVWLREIAEQLARRDPENRSRYELNAQQMIDQIEQKSAEITSRLAGLETRPFVVFHDGYRYFEERFGMQAAGSITLSPELQPSAERIQRVSRLIRQSKAVCIFSEPQFPTKLVQTVTNGLPIRREVLDPLGTNIAAGSSLYLELLERMTTSFEACLRGDGT